jgi:hypothetical protein
VSSRKKVGKIQLPFMNLCVAGRSSPPRQPSSQNVELGKDLIEIVVGHGWRHMLEEV